MARAGRHRSGVARWAAGVLVVLAAAAGCTGGGSGDGGGPGGGSSPTTAAAASVTLTVSPGKGATGVAPGDPVVVTAAGGTLEGVKVAAARGEVKGVLDAGRTTWTSKTALAFGTRYTVSAEAANPTGQRSTATSSFTTATASKQVFPAVSPLRGTTVGVGMPIRVYFDAPVTDRKAALARMKITTSVPTEGAWRWFSDSEVHWRPKVYWKAGTQVALDTDLYGVKLGPGVYGGAKADRHIEFAIGRSHVSVADARTHQMKVYVDGKLARTLPASLGKPVTGQHTEVRSARGDRQGADQGHGLDDVRAGAGRRRLPDEGRVRDPDLQQRRVRALRAVVGGAAGPVQRLARLHQPGTGERGVVLRALAAWGRRRCGRDAGQADGQGHRRAGLDDPMEPMG